MLERDCGQRGFSILPARAFYAECSVMQHDLMFFSPGMLRQSPSPTH